MVFCSLPLNFSSCFQTQPQSPALFLHLAPLTALAAICSLELHVLTNLCVRQSRIPLVVEGENEGDSGPGGCVPGVAVPTSCWPAAPHHILDGQL